MRKVTKRSKWMIFSSLAVSAALIVTLVIYSIAANRNGTSGLELGFIIGMITLVVVVLGAVMYIKLRRNKHVSKLNESYYMAYEKVCDALNTSVLGYSEKKEVRLDVLTMLIEAQDRGRDAADVVGSDIGAFIETVKSSFGYRNSFAFNLIASVQYFILLVTFIQLILYFGHIGTRSFFEAQISFSLFVMFVPLAFIIYPVLKSNMGKNRSPAVFFIPLVYGVVFIGLIILLDNTLYHVPWIRFFLDAKMKMIFSWWLLVLLTVVVAGGQLIKREMRQRSIRNL